MTRNQEIKYEITPTTQTGLEARIENTMAKVLVYVDGKKQAEINESTMVYKQTLMKNQKCSIVFKSFSSNKSFFC